MVTVTHIIGKLIRDEPIIEDALAKDLFNYSKLAGYFNSKVEQELGKPVKLSAIIMAITRQAEKIRKEYESKTSKIAFKHAELSVRSSVAEITIQKSPSFFENLLDLYKIVDLSSGDILNINVGGNEVSILFSERYLEEFRKVLCNEKIKLENTELTEVVISLPREYLYEPGVFYRITRHFAWYGLNIVEIISTLSELIIVVKNKDATAAFNVLQELIHNNRKI